MDLRGCLLRIGQVVIVGLQLRLVLLLVRWRCNLSFISLVVGSTGDALLAAVFKARVSSEAAANVRTYRFARRRRSEWLRGGINVLLRSRARTACDGLSVSINQMQSFSLTSRPGARGYLAFGDRAHAFGSSVETPRRAGTCSPGRYTHESVTGRTAQSCRQQH